MQKHIIPALLALQFMLACSNTPTESDSKSFPVVTTDENRIFIEDRLGHQWDVTHAKDNYALRWAANNGHLEVVKYLKSLN